MSFSSPSERIRTRAQRIASRVHYDGLQQKAQRVFYENHGLTKIAIILLVALLTSIICGSWNPPLRYRLFTRPDRDVICNTPFSAFNSAQTKAAREEARQNALHYYAHDVEKLEAYKRNFVREVHTLMGVNDLRQISPDVRVVLRRYLPPGAKQADEVKTLQKFQEYFEEDIDLANFRMSLDKVFRSYEENGIVSKIHPVYEGNQFQIFVYNVAGSTVSEYDDFSDSKSEQEFVDTLVNPRKVAAQDVLIGNAFLIKDQLNTVFNNDHELVDLLFQRIRSLPPSTLSEDLARTKVSQAFAAKQVAPIRQNYVIGEPIIRAHRKIGSDEFNCLLAEHKAYLHNFRTPFEKVVRFIAFFLIAATILMSVYALFYTKLLTLSRGNQHEYSLREFIRFFCIFLAFLLIGRILQQSFMQAGTLPELVPLLIFVQFVTFASSWVVAVVFGLILGFAYTLSGGGGVDSLLVFTGTTSFTALASRNIRSRLQLVTVTFAVGLCAFTLTLAAEYITHDYARVLLDPVERRAMTVSDLRHDVYDALVCGILGLLAGSVTAGLLPLAERFYGVLTPMQLLEYCNPSFPLLLDLNKRAPATYSHSIQTAVIAEAAAEAIGARSYLIRVGGYFHDVGKILKPEYFTENQTDGNIHDKLEPRLSALVIVSHVKDGVDLARRYHLPQAVIDLIEQHHGAMLAGYFYKRALDALRANDPDAKLDEAPFRYPGPIPQSKEAAILMLADASESASRSLSDWSPRRVESLVHKLAEMRIEDGQFNDSGLTLGEIQRIEQSIVNTLLASAHSRIKYDDDKDKQQPTVKEEKEPAKSQPAAPAENKDASAAKPSKGANDVASDSSATIDFNNSGVFIRRPNDSFSRYDGRDTEE
ncbi:MAG: HDIG domain-containing protein [Planctomycetia bacterium]|nr:HDIG domain-containing protein [Planctomycetia bacterium]